MHTHTHTNMRPKKCGSYANLCKCFEPNASKRFNVRESCGVRAAYGMFDRMQHCSMDKNPHKTLEKRDLSLVYASAILHIIT